MAKRADVAEPRRADAARNRERVLAAAEKIFAAEGVAASTEDVAREAGVGAGTVFRHFPTKRDLLRAIIAEKLARATGEARALIARGDPSRAFFDFFALIVQRLHANRAFGDILADETVKDAKAEFVRELKRAMATLLASAQAAGAARGDIGPDDVMALLSGAFKAAERAKDPRRVVEVIISGLRAGKTSAAPARRG